MAEVKNSNKPTESKEESKAAVPAPSSGLFGGKYDPRKNSDAPLDWQTTRPKELYLGRLPAPGTAYSSELPPKIEVPTLSSLTLGGSPMLSAASAEPKTVLTQGYPNTINSNGVPMRPVYMISAGNGTTFLGTHDGAQTATVNPTTKSVDVAPSGFSASKMFKDITEDRQKLGLAGDDKVYLFRPFGAEVSPSAPHKTKEFLFVQAYSEADKKNVTLAVPMKNVIAEKEHGNILLTYNKFTSGMPPEQVRLTLAPDTVIGPVDGKTLISQLPEKKVVPSAEHVFNPALLKRNDSKS